jgi:hypothetical protein
MDGGPYLDRIATTGHSSRGPGGAAERPEYQRLLIQPVSIPSLSHTGCVSAFTSRTPVYHLPNGAIGPALKDSISNGVRSYPRLFSKDTRERPRVLRPPAALRQPLTSTDVTPTQRSRRAAKLLMAAGPNGKPMTYKAMKEMMIG